MAGEMPEYLEWIRTQPCCMASGSCYGVIQAHHQTGHGMGMKNHDRDTMPLCAVHHRNFHDLSGPFKGWDKAKVKEWQTEQVVRQRAAYEVARPPFEDWPMFNDDEMPF